MRRLLFILTIAFTLTSCCNTSDLVENFKNPPLDSRPGVYWYFMDGNLSKEGITKDLQAMKKEGIGYVVFLEVNVGVPQGNTKFMTDDWIDTFLHAVKECRKYDIQMILGIGPGWTGSGGPWVDGNCSMKHLISSEITIDGNGKDQTISLEIPSPHEPYFGRGIFNEKLAKQWNEYYENVAVLAFPHKDNSCISDIDEKAMYTRAPYSSVIGVKQYLVQNEHGKTGPAPDEVIDLTSLIDKSGMLTWNVPDGKWTIMRFVSRNNGALTRPAPEPGVGFECDKFDSTALLNHLSHFTDILLYKIGKETKGQFGGLKYLHMDSWEMGAQNWTSDFREEFMTRRGYDPLPYFPVYAGHTIGSSEESERFLWDLRKTTQDLILEEHVQVVKNYAHKHGYQLSIEPYDMNPTQDMELAVAADYPMCEFWSVGYGYNTSFAVIEGTSAAHLIGQNVVPSESFTSHLDAYRQYPGSIKEQNDWAFTSGINRLIYHTFQHQTLADSLLPGMSMGPYGLQWNRNETWWDFSHGYHTYVARSQYLLQRGRTVSDILYLNPESIPHVFKAPSSALIDFDSMMPDKRGHSFDVCPPSMIMKATVEDGEIVFPSGARYKILILPDFPTMTVELLEKIGELSESGATIVGNPPLHSPSLSGYPLCDSIIKNLTNIIWANGKIIRPLESDNLYQPYPETAAILERMRICEDFNCEGDKIRYTHRTSPEADIYFLSNRTNEKICNDCRFRVKGKKPYRFDPMSGCIYSIPKYSEDGDVTRIKLEMEAKEAYFVVFTNEEIQAEQMSCNFPKKHEVLNITGPWNVKFKEKWGPSCEISLDYLSDWTKSENPDIKYYSGKAMYKTKFQMDKCDRGYILDLGEVCCMGEVYVNGKNMGIVWFYPWQIDITKALRKGTNTLEVNVANLWQNRIIGDLPKTYDGPEGGKWPEWILEGTPRQSDRNTFCAVNFYQATDSLLPSGLKGPVRILEY